MATGTRLAYPIRLYPLKNRLIFFSLLCLVFIVVPIRFYQGNEPFFILLCGFVMMLLGIIGFFLLTSLLLSGKPQIIIQSFGLEVFSSLRPSQKSQVQWRDIENIQLDSTTHRDVIRWQLTIDLASGKQLNYALNKMRFENYILNEKEIFHLIEQAFHKQPAYYKNMPMGIESRINIGTDLICVGCCILYLIVSWLMK